MTASRPGRMNGRTALVTGASRGIGEAIATALAREGATVLLSSRKLDGLEAARDRILADVPDALLQVRPCHTGDPAAIAALFEQLDADGVVVDALVNNAATNPYFGPLLGGDHRAFDKTIDVNVKGPFELSRQVAQRLIDAGKPGAIVNISSIFGMVGAPFQGFYAMTKAALLSLTKTAAVEWGGAGIRVNAIAPGLVETRFAGALLGNDAIVDQYNQRSALGRYGQPDEIAGAVVFLLSDEGRYCTGQTLALDGGWTINS
ncbi:MAG: glucose 1-dehydrogenase [Alphaproteobacteria bacterium]|nr:glucose 1-dehydrogenase [Alphaproteobacteria bacterium]